MGNHFDIRPECEATWAVYDRLTGELVKRENVVTVGLNIADADELAEQLNLLEEQHDEIASRPYA